MTRNLWAEPRHYCMHVLWVGNHMEDALMSLQPIKHRETNDQTTISRALCMTVMPDIIQC